MDNEGDTSTTTMVENQENTTHSSVELKEKMDTCVTNGVLNGPLENHVDNRASESKSGHGERKEGSSKEHKSSSSDKHRSSSSHKHSSSSSKHHSSSSSSSKHKSEHRDKDGHRSSSGHHNSSDKPSSSSSKDKPHSSSSSNKSSHKDKHRDKDKSHASTSSSSHRDGEKKPSSSSSSSKHHSSGERHHGSGDRHRSDKDKHSSSSSKDKHHKSSHSDKDRHRDNKDKHKSSSSDKPKGDGDMSREIKVASKTESVSPSKIKTEQQIKTEPRGQSVSPVKAKAAPRAQMSDDDLPLSARMDSTTKVKSEKRPIRDEDSDDVPLSARMEKKVKKEKDSKKRKTEDYDISPIAKKKKKKTHHKQDPVSPTKKGKAKKEDETQETWKWWEEDGKEEGVKWHFLEHKGPVFAPPYEPLPDDVHFFYDGKRMKLSQNTEEVAGFYGRMIDHEYTTRVVFNENFMKDWRRVMTSKEKEIIKNLSKCNFKEIDAHYKRKSEERKAMSKEHKKKIKEEKDAIVKEYGFCTIDGHKEKVGNFNIEPPSLFRGRGNHPKQGMLKRRAMPEDVIINCSKGSTVPKAPAGHKWKEIRHDNTVTWLASWTENIQNSTKYVMLAVTSRLKGEKDWKKYETARSLHTKIDKIRASYREDLKSKEMRLRQRAVAMYFIDKLALRAGNEKDEDTADTVGCCSLRYEHITLHDQQNGKQFVVEFDFLGKDSIRYHNSVPVDKRVFKNLTMFMENKSDGDDLFDRLNTSILNKHLNTIMDGLTAKVFRTYNASRTLQEQLDLLTVPEDPIPSKILAYNRANRSVAILCNHQRAVSKNFGKQMENLQTKVDAKKDAVHAAKKEYKQAKQDHKAMKTEKSRSTAERKKKTVERLEEQLVKLEISVTDKDENKDIALGTSKLNYLDPRISVAWCKKWNVPMEKVYNKTQREKFAWAIDMAEAEYKFTEMDDD